MVLGVVLEIGCVDWEGHLVFSEDFNGNSLRQYYWESEDGCEGM